MVPLLAVKGGGAGFLLWRGAGVTASLGTRVLVLLIYGSFVLQ